jgi:hypothetical protein
MLGIAGCAPGPVGGRAAQSTAPRSSDSSGAVAPAGSETPSRSATACPTRGGWDCDLQGRIAAARAYIATRAGTVGVVLRDRRTGAVWRSEYADRLVWTASTIKLAMVVDLYTRSYAGRLVLGSQDRQNIAAMLHSSDDDAADALWYKFSGSDHLSFNNDFPEYGLTSLVPRSGFTGYYPYWGFQQCTPNDLDRLMQYLLTRLVPDDRAYVVSQLQSVAADQQWGVWSAGGAGHAGNKNGWSVEQGGWVVNSVGFAGRGQRYTLAIMNSLNGQGGYDEGVATDSRVAQILLKGRS